MLRGDGCLQGTQIVSEGAQLIASVVSAAYRWGGWELVDEVLEAAEEESLRVLLDEEVPSGARPQDDRRLITRAPLGVYRPGP